MPQLAIAQAMTTRLPGRVSTTVPAVIVGRIALTAIAFGLLCQRSPADAATTTRAPADNSAASATAILATGGVTAAGALVYTAAQFNGAVGSALLRPTRRITITTSAHANWDLSIARLWAIDEAGALVSEPVHIIDGGGQLWTSVRRYQRVIRFELPTQAGAAGTFTIGYAASVAAAFNADVDAIAATVASAAAVQVLAGAALDGILGQVTSLPAKAVTFVCDAHADWDATNVIVTGEDEFGSVQTAVLAIATSTTATSVKLFRRVTQVRIPVQTAGGGTATIGYAADSGGWVQWGVLIQPDGVARYDATREQLAVPTGYQAADEVGLLVSGEIDMICASACTADAQVFVILAGAGVLGQVRSDADAGNAVPVRGWYFAETLAAAGNVKVRVALGAS